MAAPAEHDVMSLEDALDNSSRLRDSEPDADFAGDLKGLVGGQASDPGQQRSQVLAIHVLHGYEGRAFGFADVVDAADVGMRDLARNTDFTMEALQQALVAGGLFGQEFQCDGL